MTATVAFPVAVAKAFSPGHITGFVAEKSVGFNNYLDVGSTGAGFSIEDGITTTVEIHEHKLPSYQISINGSRVEDAQVSKWVADGIYQTYKATLLYKYQTRMQNSCGLWTGFEWSRGSRSILCPKPGIKCGSKHSRGSADRSPSRNSLQNRSRNCNCRICWRI